MPKHFRSSVVLPLVIIAGALTVAGMFVAVAIRQLAPPRAAGQRSAPPTAVTPTPPVVPPTPSAQPAPPSLTLVAVGDIMLGRAVGRKIARHGVDYPFMMVQTILDQGDVVFGNLEAPLVPGPDVPDGSLRLRADPEVADGLQRAGFNVLSIANNHLPDFGVDGIRGTMATLDRADIAHVGAGLDASAALTPAVVKRNGVRTAFLAFNDTDVVPGGYGATSKRAGTAFASLPAIQAAVSAVRSQADIVVVSLHAGTEYANEPNDRQRSYAHAAIDAGADLVIGHHPHVVQPVEKYQGKYILYSLGNFVFDQGWSQPTQEGAAAIVTFIGREVSNLRVMPVLIQDYAQPRPLKGKEAAAVLARMQSAE